MKLNFNPIPALLLVTVLLSGCALPAAWLSVPQTDVEPVPQEADATPVAVDPVDTPAALSLEGRWEGAISVLGMQLDIIATFTQEDELLTGTIDIPQQGASDLPLHDITFEAPNIHFEMLEGPQLAVFEGELDGDTMSGSFEQAGYEGTFTLTQAEATAPPSAEEAPQTRYTDPQGLFSVPVPTNWTLEEIETNETESYGLLTSPEGGIEVYVLAVPADSARSGIEAAWDRVDPEFDLEPEQEQDPPPSQPGIEETFAVVYDTENDNRIVIASADLLDGIAYVQIVDAGLIPFQQRASQVQIIGTGWTINALETADLTGVEPQPLTDEMLANLEDYVVEKMDEFRVPGAAIAVVRDNEIVYSNGFGTRGPDSDEPITAQTHMMIGSTGKTMTTMLMATLVDDGLMEWTTPVVDVLPRFSLADPERTKQITLRHLVCACTGVPRRDLELIFNAFDQSAEDVVEELATYELFTDFGEAFQYSNQMVATGGYAAGAVAGGEWGNLFDAYAEALQERVLDPIGMENTTLSFDEVVARDNYATPHGVNLAFEYYPIPMEMEMLLLPVAPAGVHWSTAEEMARYLIVELNTGVAPDGSRVVSEENLTETWGAQVSVTADTSYGLGWLVGDYKGLQMLQHGGNTFGFTSDLAFLPDGDVGIVVLTNGRGTNLFNEAVRFRLLEMLYEQEPEFETQAQFAWTQMQNQYEELQDDLGEEIDAEFIEPYLGRYTNPALGEIVFTLADGTLTADTGEFQTILRPAVGEDAEEGEYVTFDMPLAGLGIQFQTGAEGARTVIAGSGVNEYMFTKVE